MNLDTLSKRVQALGALVAQRENERQAEDEDSRSILAAHQARANPEALLAILGKIFEKYEQRNADGKLTLPSAINDTVGEVFDGMSSDELARFIAVVEARRAARRAEQEEEPA